MSDLDARFRQLQATRVDAPVLEALSWAVVIGDRQLAQGQLVKTKLVRSWHSVSYAILRRVRGEGV